MKKSFQSPHFKWGLTAFVVIVACISFFFVIFKMQGLFTALQNFVGILKPFIYGAVISYFMLPVYNFFVSRLTPALKHAMSNTRRATSISKMISSIASVVLLLGVISAVIALVLPQLATSIFSLANSMPDYLNEMSNWLEDFLRNSPSIRDNMMQMYNEFTDWMIGWMKDDMLPKLIGLMSGGLLGTVNMLKNIVVGIIASIYMLCSKDLFAAQSKKIVYSAFSTEHANLFIKNMRFIHRVFGGFITGKLMDSLIIGLISFVVLGILKMPYVVLISVVIGITNFIPFFGPFIGAIPSALLILVIDPIQCVYFIIFVLILQQFDGNILGPKILGDSTGLSSFWVMFAILVAGGLFGFVGMIIGVPLFAVLYSLISSLVNRSLLEKDLPVQTLRYFHTDHIDPDTHRPVPFAAGKPAEEKSVSLKRKPHRRHKSDDHKDKP